jgi:acetolactate synthase-1/2/3 large subunit
MTIANTPPAGGRMTGGRALAEMLRLAGLGPMFGMGGFQLLPFYDAVRELQLTHHLVNDERCAAFAADAYARVTNRPAVCDGTLGPGATNLVTALVESSNAGIPLLAITGDAHRGHAGKNMTQECRQAELLRPAAKQVIRLESTARIPDAVRFGLGIATSGRPGPVVLDIPEDVCHGEHDFAATEFHVDAAITRAPARRARPASADIERAAARLAAARRPVMLVGGGIHLSQAHAALLQFATAQSIPVAHTMSGKGGIACTDPLSAGLFGRYSRIANDLIGESDCLFVVGCKLGEIATRRYSLLPDTADLIHLDVVAEEFGRCYPPRIALWGDARLGLEDLNAALSAPAAGLRAGRAVYRAEVAVRMAAWRREAESRLRSDERPINVARLVQTLNDGLPPQAILVADGGFAAHWTGLLFDTKVAGRHYVSDRGFASIGYGVPGGIGAALAAPDRPVVAVTGDGGFNMAMGELETARRVGAGNLTIVIINNAASGYVKALQHSMFGARYQSADLTELRYADIASAMGCHGIRVEDPARLADAMRAGIEHRSTPSVIEVMATRDPARMLPGVDSRTVAATPGDRIA